MCRKPVTQCAWDKCINDVEQTGKVGRFRHYCSTRCKNAAMASRARARRRRETEFKVCDHRDCNERFFPSIHSQRFCTLECQRSERRKKQVDHRARMSSSGPRTLQRRTKIRERRATILQMAGGCCQQCGYNRCASALQFHHRDPDSKLFIPSGSDLLRQWGMVIEEIAKCDLLCANCHIEVHHGMA